MPPDARTRSRSGAPRPPTSPAPTDGHAADRSRSGSTPFQRAAQRVSHCAGTATAAAIVVGTAAGWTVIGALVGFPRWWELVLTGGVPVLTLLMFVVLQHTQNHDARATQLKLDELIRSTHGATNRMMTVEDASAGDLDRIREDFQDQATADERPA